MRVSHVLRAGSVIALAGLVACAEQPTTSPTDVGARKVDGVESAKQSSGSDEVVTVSPAPRPDQRPTGREADRTCGSTEAELLYAAKAYDAAIVDGHLRQQQDPHPRIPVGGRRPAARRGGGRHLRHRSRAATTAFGIPNLPAIEVDGGGFRLVDPGGARGVHRGGDAGLAGPPVLRLADRAGARCRPAPTPTSSTSSCSDNPARARTTPSLPTSSRPVGSLPSSSTAIATRRGRRHSRDLLHVHLRGRPGHARSRATTCPRTSTATASSIPALVEIYYNPSFIWTNRGTPGGFIDFYSVITHETGHGLGLAHFGKVFVTKKDAADGIPDQPTSSTRPRR